MSTAMNRIPALVTLLVASGAGVLAAVATSEVAVATGAVSSPALGWLIPLIVEGAAVTSGLLAYSRSQRSLSARAERATLAVLMALAVWVNASHASGNEPLSVVLAAAPPVVLMACIELLLHRNRGEQGDASVSAEQEHPPVPSTERLGEQVSAEVSGRHVSAPLAVSTERFGSGEHLSGERPVSTEHAGTERFETPEHLSAEPVSAPPAGDTSVEDALIGNTMSTERQVSTERLVAAAAEKRPLRTSKRVPKTSADKPSSDTKAEITERVATLLAKHPTMKAPELAAHLGVEPSSTVRRYLTEARKAAAA